MANETWGISVLRVNFKIVKGLLGIAFEYCEMELRLFSQRRYIMSKLYP